MNNNEAEIHEGTVISVSGNQITTSCEDGYEYCHTMNTDSKILCNGRPGTLKEVKAGMPIHATICEDDDSRFSSVSVRSKRSIPYA